MFKKKGKPTGSNLDLSSITVDVERSHVDPLRSKGIKKTEREHGVKIGMDGVQHEKSAVSKKMVSESQVKFRNEIMQLDSDIIDNNMYAIGRYWLLGRSSSGRNWRR